MKRLLALVLTPLALPTVSVADTLSGILVERHADPIELITPGGEPAGGPDTAYVLRRAEGTVALEDGQDERLVGQRVRVEDASSAPGVQGRARAVDSTRVAAATVPRALKVAVLMVNFTNDRSRPVTAEEVRARMWRASDSVNAYYRQQSDGAVSLVGRDRTDGDVYGWFELPIASTGCDVGDFSAYARKAAFDADVDLSGYDHVQFFFPRVAECKFAGVGEFPGRQTWINGYLDAGIIAHELGHNMGADHAGALSCTNASGFKVAISSSSNCAFAEYGDPFDAMGNARNLMSSWHRARLRQLPSEAQRTVTASGTYTLANANDPAASGSKLILIPRTRDGQPVSDYYALEIRRPLLPFDDWTADKPQATGVSIRLVPRIADLLPTKLVDNVPRTTTLDDAPLQQGLTFADPDYGIQIVNRGGTGPATLDITVPGQDATPPSAPGLVGAAKTTSGVSVSWTAAADNRGVDRYEVLRDAVVVGSSRGTSYPDAVGPGVYAYAVRAIDFAGNVGPASVPVTIDTRSAPAGTPNGTGPPGTTAGEGPAPVPEIVPKPRPRSVQRVRLIAPKPVGNVARVPKSGRLTFQASGARALSIRLGSRRVKAVRTATSTYVLPRKYRRAGRVVLRVTASGGTFDRAETFTFLVDRGRVKATRA